MFCLPPIFIDKIPKQERMRVIQDLRDLSENFSKTQIKDIQFSAFFTKFSSPNSTINQIDD